MRGNYGVIENDYYYYFQVKSSRNLLKELDIDSFRKAAAILGVLENYEETKELNEIDFGESRIGVEYEKPQIPSKKIKKENKTPLLDQNEMKDKPIF